MVPFQEEEQSRRLKNRHALLPLNPMQFGMAGGTNGKDVEGIPKAVGTDVVQMSRSSVESRPTGRTEKGTKQHLPRMFLPSQFSCQPFLKAAGGILGGGSGEEYLSVRLVVLAGIASLFLLLGGSERLLSPGIPVPFPAAVLFKVSFP